LQFFGKSEQLCRRFSLQFLEIHGSLRRVRGGLARFWESCLDGVRRPGGEFRVYRESVKENRLVVWRSPCRKEICKSNAITRGLVQRPSQNGLATTSSTIAIIMTVGNSF